MITRAIGNQSSPGPTVVFTFRMFTALPQDVPTFPVRWETSFRWRCNSAGASTLSHLLPPRACSRRRATYASFPLRPFGSFRDALGKLRARDLSHVAPQLP